MDGCPSGQRPEITRADQRAIVVEVGGRIRQYRVGARLSRVLTRVGAPWDGPVLRAGHALAQPPRRRQLSHRRDRPPCGVHRAGGTQRHQRLLALAIA